MPQIIPVIVAWMQTSVTGYIFGMAVKMAVAYAISRALSPKPGKLGSMGSPITMSRDAAAARRVIYGQTRASGPIIFAHVTGDKNSDLHLVIALAGHKLSEIGQILINDEVVSFDTDGETATGKYAGKLRVRKWLGNQTTADSVLVAESGGVWTSAHVCQGIACIYAKLVFDQDVFPQGIPNISAIVKGREVYDPRDESTAWTDNPALCALDYMRDTDVGFAATDSEIDYASHAAAASICDEAVALAAGGTEKRYRCAGVFATDGEPASIIEQLVGTMSGTMVYSGGKFSLKAGAYEIPTVEFDESHLRGPIQFQTDSSRREVCNIVKGTYTSPADLYQPRDFPQWVDAAAVTADAEEITRDLALDWVHSASQAQRIAAIEERASRLGGTIILQCNLSGLRVQVGDTITVKNARFGWTSGEVFKVVQFKFSAVDGAVGVDLTCRRTASSVYAWSVTSEAAVDPGAVPDGGDDICTIPQPGDTPGTIGDINGGGGSEGAGGLTVEARGNTVELCGVLENVTPGTYRAASDGYQWHGPAITASTPPKVYKRHSGSGIITQAYYLPGCGGDGGVGPVSTASGALVYAPSGLLCNVTQNDLAGAYTGMDRIETYTRTTVAIGVETGNCQPVNEGYHAIVTGSQSLVKSVEDTEGDGIGRVLSASAWASGGSEAIYEPRVTITTFLYRELRVKSSWTDLKPWWTYTVTIYLERVEIMQGGGEVGLWEDAGTIVAGMTANLAGEASIDWQTITAPRGYKVRIRPANGYAITGG